MLDYRKNTQNATLIVSHGEISGRQGVIAWKHFGGPTGKEGPIEVMIARPGPAGN